MENRDFKEWTQAEEETLRELKTQKLTHAEIAKRMGRTEGAIQARLEKLNIRTLHHWTEAEKQRLKRLKVSSNRSDAEIAKLMGRSIKSVEAQCSRLNLKCPSYTKWTAAEEERLRQSVAAKEPLHSLQEDINRSENAIRVRAAKLGLRYIANPRFDKNDPDTIAAVIAMRVTDKMIISEIADRYRTSPLQISRLLKAAGIPIRKLQKHPVRRWTELETHRLQKLVRSGISMKEIQKKFPRRTLVALYEKCRKLNLVPAPTSEPATEPRTERPSDTVSNISVETFKEKQQQKYAEHERHRHIQNLHRLKEAAKNAPKETMTDPYYDEEYYNEPAPSRFYE